jgi:hypothetical protein
LLGIVHPRNRALVGWHDDGTRDDGARKRAPSHFIDSSQQRSELGPKRPLDPTPPLRRNLAPRLAPALYPSADCNFGLLLHWLARQFRHRAAGRYSSVPVVGTAILTFFSRIRVALPVR